MNLKDAVNKIVQLPRKFSAVGNGSIYSLLKETGYFQAHDQISEDVIRDALTCHPECVDEWMHLSEDKRSDAGWYFMQLDETHYAVGHFIPKAGDAERREYSDPIQACAAFIKHEIEDIRSGVESQA